MHCAHSLAARSLVATVMLVSCGGLLHAQILPRVSDSVTFKGVIQPVARPTRLPPPPPRAAPPPPPAATAQTSQAIVAATGVAGYEIAVGPMVDVPPLAIAGTSAQCPTGKVALTAGVDFSGPGDASYGLEVLGAWPDGRNGTVRVRNANVFVRASVRAYAVCVSGLPGRRVEESTKTDWFNDSQQFCASGEGVAGGGVMGNQHLVISASAPTIDRVPRNLWRSSFISTLGFINTTVRLRVICAPVAQLADWQVIESAPVELGARVRATLSTQCPNGTVPLTFGVLTMGPTADLIWNTLVPAIDGSVSAQVQNRNIIAGGGNVRVSLSTACGRRA